MLPTEWGRKLRAAFKISILGLCLIFSLVLFSQTRSAAQQIQQKAGSCSALSVSNQGTIVINCPGIAPEFAEAIVKQLDELYQQLRKQSEISTSTNQVFRNQNELIDILRQQLRGSVERYEKLFASLPSDENGKKARALILKGEFDQAEALLQSEAAKEEQGIKRAAETQFRLGSIYALKFNWKGALPYFKKAFGLAPEEVFYAESFAVASYASNQLQDAETGWTKALQIYRDRASREPDAMEGVATILSNFGNLYLDTNRAAAAEKSFNESLKIRRELAAHDSSYRGLVASSLYKLAILYDEVKRDTEAEQSFKDSIALYKEAAPSNPDELEAGLAITQSRLAYFYVQRNRAADAERLSKETRATYSRLVDRDPVHRPELAIATNDLAWFYEQEGKTADAEQAYADALKVFRELKQGDENGFQYEMARGLSGLADIYQANNRKPEAEKAYLEALGLRRDLARRDPSYRPFVANILVNLGSFYLGSERNGDAQAAHEEALGLARDLAALDPEYRSLEAIVLFNLGNDQKAGGHAPEAENSYKGALAIYRDLAKQDADSFVPFVAIVQQSLGLIYKDSKRFPEAGVAIREALAIYRKLAKGSSDEYRQQATEMTKLLNDLAVESRGPRRQKSSR